MVITRNDCCGCATEMYPCLGNLCERQHAKHLICDCCKDDVSELYQVDVLELCEDCLESHYPDADTSDFQKICH